MQRWRLIVAGAASNEPPGDAIARAKNAIAYWAGYDTLPFAGPRGERLLSPIIFGEIDASRSPRHEAESLRAKLPELPLLSTAQGAPWYVDLEWFDPEHSGRASMPWPVLSAGWWGRPSWAPDPRGVRSVVDSIEPGRDLRTDETESAIEAAKRFVSGAAKAAAGPLATGLAWVATAAVGLGALWIFLNRSKE
jgi:hypothetical protein